MLLGFVMINLNNYYLVRTDDNWEDWDAKAFIDALKKWLKRKKTEERPGDSHKAPFNQFKPQRNLPKTPEDRYRYKKHWFAKEDGGKDTVDCQTSRGTALCMYCKKDHWVIGEIVVQPSKP